MILEKHEKEILDFACYTHNALLAKLHRIDRRRQYLLHKALVYKHRGDRAQLQLDKVKLCASRCIQDARARQNSAGSQSGKPACYHIS